MKLYTTFSRPQNMTSRRSHMLASRRASRLATRQAFSMVELLVVIAIITILTALLIPMVQRARVQAAQTKCLSNIRQIGAGLAMYVTDFGEYPPADDLPQYTAGSSTTPVFYAARRTGLLSISQDGRGFNRFYMACPDGWASTGDQTWYASRGALDAKGGAFMDYAYWGQRYPKRANLRYDPRYESFKYSAKLRGTKILVTDVVTDLGSAYLNVTSRVGEGNHSTGNAGRVHTVRQTDGRGGRIGPDNNFRSMGGSVLYSDYSAHWFNPTSFTGNTQGMCFPNPDQWNLR